MLLMKLKTIPAIGVVLAVVGFAVVAGAFRTFADAQAPPSPPVVANPPASQPEEPSPASAKLSSQAMPVDALVSLTRTGTVAVTRLVHYYEPVTTCDGNGKQITSYHHVAQPVTTQYSREDVKFYDTKGKIISVKEMPRLLKDEVTAFVYDGQEPDPLQLKHFKEGTLIIVVPLPKIEQPTMAESEDKPDQVPPPPVFPAGPVVLPPSKNPSQDQFFELPPLPGQQPSFDWSTFIAPAEKKLRPISEEQMKLFKELQGEWRFVSCNHVHPKDLKKAMEALEDFRLEISHRNLVRIGIGPNFERANPVRLTLLVSPGSPNHFDLQTYDADDDAKVSLGIYKLKGDELTLCLAPPGGERPRTFELPEVSKHQWFVLRRVVPNEKPR